MATKPNANPCVEVTSVSRVQVEEHKISATFLNVNRASIRKIRVDNCLVKTGIRCDWIVSKAKCVDVFVELKGKDVDHALAQLWATMQFWESNDLRDENQPMSALIVCKQYPRINTKIQIAALKMAREFAAPLHIKTRNEEYAFCTLASFN